MEELQECQICCLPFSQHQKPPKRLPCDHTFCGTCVMEMTDGGWISCPTCRKIHDVRDVKHDFQREKFLDALAEQAQALMLQQQGASAVTSSEPKGNDCDHCESKPVACWCEDCESGFCHRCKTGHLKLKVCRNHTIVDIKLLKKRFNDEVEDIASKLQTNIKDKRRWLREYQDSLTTLNKQEHSDISSIGQQEELVKKQVEEHFQQMRRKVKEAFQESRAFLASQQQAFVDDVTEINRKHRELNELIASELYKPNAQPISAIKEYLQSLKTPDHVRVQQPKVKLITDSKWQVAGCAQLQISSLAQLLTTPGQSLVGYKVLKYRHTDFSLPQGRENFLKHDHHTRFVIFR